jgi:hypothetical protein
MLAPRSLVMKDGKPVGVVVDHPNAPTMTDVKNG